MKNIQWVAGFIRWEVSHGSRIHIGLDAIKGRNGNHTLSVHLLKYIHRKGKYVLGKIFQIRGESIDRQRWIRAIELGLNDYLAVEWER